MPKIGSKIADEQGRIAQFTLRIKGCAHDFWKGKADEWGVTPTEIYRALIEKTIPMIETCTICQQFQFDQMDETDDS